MRIGVVFDVVVFCSERNPDVISLGNIPPDSSSPAPYPPLIPPLLPLPPHPNNPPSLPIPLQKIPHLPLPRPALPLQETLFQGLAHSLLLRDTHRQSLMQRAVAKGLEGVVERGLLLPPLALEGVAVQEGGLRAGAEVRERGAEGEELVREGGVGG